MKLLIVTQKVDQTDPVLGFFHRWIEDFAKNCESVLVIGQYVAEHNLPSNVYVKTLRKELGASIFSRILRFWKLQWSLKKEYDAVLVHMTPIWVVLGSFGWMLMRKRIYLWYEARGGGWTLFFALQFVKKVFCASRSSKAALSKKCVITGHGIDTNVFIPSGNRDPYALIAVGRITRAKRPDIILKCVAELPKPYRLLIAGAPVTKSDEAIAKECVQYIQEHHLDNRVKIKPLALNELLQELQRSSLFVHASETTLDKAVLEAMACGCLVVSCSDAFTNVLPEACQSDKESMSTVSQKLLSLSQESQHEIRRELRAIVVNNHSLETLVTFLTTIMSEDVRQPHRYQ